MIITVGLPFFADWTCSLISVQWCCCLVGNVEECCSLTSFRGRTRFPLFLMLPLLIPTTDSKTVLKERANCAIILAKILSYAPRAGLPQFPEAFPLLK